MLDLSGWEVYPTNLSSEYPNYDLEYCRRRLQDDSTRLFSTTSCEITIQTMPKRIASSHGGTLERKWLKDVITNEDKLERVVAVSIPLALRR